MEDHNDDNLGREIERSWLIRGEYHKVFEARAMGYLLFGGVLIGGSILCFLLKALGIDW